MKVLVTGATGQLGRALVELGPALRSVELVVTSRAQLDLSDEASIRLALKAIDPEVVVNTAAFTAVDRAEIELETARTINAEAPQLLARSLARSSGRMIQLSTDYVFNGDKSRPYLETDPPAPANAYGFSKWLGEEGVRESLPAHLILRTAWVYSPWCTNFVKTMLSLARTRDTVSVVADQVGNPTSALDLAAALSRILVGWSAGGKQGLGETFHFSGGGETSWAGLAREVFAVSMQLGGPSARVSDITTSEYLTLAARPANSRLDGDKFAATFGYRAPHWRQSVAEVVTRLLA